jgi:DNA topoisomerase-1
MRDRRCRTNLEAAHILIGLRQYTILDVDYKDNKKVQQQAPQAQEAHEAIRPTHMEVETINGDAYEKNLYRLIWQRTIQSVMSAARGETCHVTIQLDADFSWLARWKRTTFEGWRRVGSVANLEEDEPLLEATT